MKQDFKSDRHTTKNRLSGAHRSTAQAVAAFLLALTVAVSGFGVLPAAAQGTDAPQQGAAAAPVLLEETAELAREDPLSAPEAADSTDSVQQLLPENTQLLTPEQIREALDAGAMTEAEKEGIDTDDENGFFMWLWEWLFGSGDDDKQTYSGWRTVGKKTYYYKQNSSKPVTGIQAIDGKLYYFDDNGVKQENVTFGVDVSKYQTNVNWKKLKNAGASFAMIRIGYRGYGNGTLVKDPMFEEHYSGADKAGMKIGVYFFSQAINEEEAREEAQGCNWALNGRDLDFAVYFDTESSGAKNNGGRADNLSKTVRTDCAVAFCDEIESLGYRGGVYASTSWFKNRVDLSKLRSYDIWNAHYGVSSSPIDCNIWQGSCDAHVSGYDGDLDVDIFYK